MRLTDLPCDLLRQVVGRVPATDHLCVALSHRAFFVACAPPFSTSALASAARPAGA